MAEYQNLTELMEAIQLTSAARDKVKEAQEQLDAADNATRATANENLEKCTQELTQLIENETNLRKVALGYLSETKPPNHDQNTVSTEGIQSGNEPVPPTTSGTASFNFKLPKPEKFKRGQNFSKFCEKFVDYITLSKIKDDNLYILFINMVDDFTSEKLRKIALTPGQRKDARLFIQEYEKKMNPSHEGRTMRSKLADLRQDKNEKAEDLAYRITDIASRAYTESEVALKEEACFSAFMKGLTDSDLKMKLHENTNIMTFEQAIEEATRLESIKAAIGNNPQCSDSTGNEELEVYKLQKDSDREREVRPPAQLDRHRYSRDSRQDDYQQGSNSSYSRNSTPSWKANVNRPDNGIQRSSGNQSRKINSSRMNRSGPIICFKCNQPNHIARNCTAPSGPLNY